MHLKTDKVDFKKKATVKIFFFAFFFMCEEVKGGFFSERADEFVISLNIGTKLLS